MHVRTGVVCVMHTARMHCSSWIFWFQVYSTCIMHLHMHMHLYRACCCGRKAVDATLGNVICAGQVQGSSALTSRHGQVATATAKSSFDWMYAESACSRNKHN